MSLTDYHEFVFFFGNIFQRYFLSFLANVKYIVLLHIPVENDFSNILIHSTIYLPENFGKSKEKE